MDRSDPSGNCPNCLIGAAISAIVSAGVQYGTTGLVDIQQVGIAAAGGFITGGASTLIAAGAALASVRIGLNIVAGAAVGAGQATASKVAETGSLPSKGEVARGAVLGAVGAGVGSAAGEAVSANMSNAAGFIGASAGSSAATKSLAGTVKEATMSAATDAEKSAIARAPAVGSAVAAGVQGVRDGSMGVAQSTGCLSGKKTC
jgi:hypothetical protein